MYHATFDEGWIGHFQKLESVMKERVSRKIGKILEHPKKRHLKKSARFFVDEAGQNRIVYRVFGESREVRFYFAGNHKQYEKWYWQFF